MSEKRLFGLLFCYSPSFHIFFSLMTQDEAQNDDHGFARAKELLALGNVEAVDQIDVPDSELNRAHYEKLFGHSFKIKEVNNGDIVPAGGGSFINEKLDTFVQADFDTFDEFIRNNIETSDAIDLEALGERLSNAGITIEPATFAKLHTFTKLLGKQFPNADGAAERRRQLYNRPETPQLSEIMSQGVQECAEIALLAQGVLQREDIESEYTTGAVLWDRDQEFSEAHSFIVLKSERGTYIFDPTNPTHTNAGLVPSIYEVPGDLWGKIGADRKAFVTARNVLSHREAYFGVNNGTNVGPENIF
jgi:hypothetical protein